MTHLVPDKGLFDGCEILQRGKQHVTVFWTTGIFNEVSQFLGKGRKNFIFVLDRVWTPWSVRDLLVDKARAYRPRKVSVHPSFGQGPKLRQL